MKNLFLIALLASVSISVQARQCSYDMDQAARDLPAKQAEYDAKRDMANTYLWVLGLLKDRFYAQDLEEVRNEREGDNWERVVNDFSTHAELLCEKICWYANGEHWYSALKGHLSIRNTGPNRVWIMQQYKGQYLYRKASLHDLFETPSYKDLGLPEKRPEKARDVLQSELAKRGCIK